MGRKKSYDRDDVIDKAVEIFRDYGFAGTSADMLSKGLGVNRYGIYAEFGSKQGLFDIALERYDDINVDRNFGPLEADGAGIDAIRDLFVSLGTAEDNPAWGRGCLLCNTAVENGPTDPSGAGHVQGYFKRLCRAFLSALSNAFAKGDLADTVDIKAEADFLTASALGLFVLLRAKAPGMVIQNAANRAIEHLLSLQPERG